MTTMELPALCEQAMELAKNHQIAPDAYDRIFKHAATTTFFEEPNEGRAMARFMDTAIGKRMLNVAVSLPTAAEAVKIANATTGVIKYDPHEVLKRVGGFGSTDDDDDDKSSPTNPYHSALQALADKHIERGGKKMTREQAYAHLALHSPVGQKLMTHAKEWDMQRADRAQRGE